MASSQTQNLQLIEYGAGSDNFLRTDYNGNLTKIDNFAGQTNDSLSAVQNGLAYIVGNTNTTGGTLAVGQFVYVKGHSTIAEGLRKVTASISANASITTSNTDACSEGGLNALNSNLTSLSDQIGNYGDGDFSAVQSRITVDSSTKVISHLGIVYVSAKFTANGGRTNAILATLPAINNNGTYYLTMIDLNTGACQNAYLTYGASSYSYFNAPSVIDGHEYCCVGSYPTTI